jgi:hypothetical protein
MRRYTLEDFKTFEKDEYGVLICPQGDYTSLKNIPARCSFGEWYSFGEWCSFGERCSFDEDANVNLESYKKCCLPEDLAGKGVRHIFSGAQMASMSVADVLPVHWTSGQRECKKHTGVVCMEEDIWL